MTRQSISEQNDLGDLEQGDELVVVRDGATGKAAYEPPADGRLIPEGGSEGQVIKKTADGIEWGDDEVGQPGSGEENVNADWNATSGDAEILNKPDIPSGDRLVPTGGSAGQVVKKTATGVEWGADEVGQAGSGQANVQSDWAETDDTEDSFIRNKPDIPAEVPVGRQVPDGGSSGQVLKRDAGGGLVWRDDEVGSPGSGEENVNADWDATSGDAEILNKPDIPTAASINTQIDDKVPAVYQDGNTDEFDAAKIPVASDTTRGGITHALFTRLSGLNNTGVMAKSHTAGVRLRTGSAENLTPDTQNRIYATAANIASGAWWRDNEILHGWIQDEGANIPGLPTGQNYFLLTVKDATNDIHQWAFPDAASFHFERRWNSNANPGDFERVLKTLTGTATPTNSIGTTGSIYIKTDTSVPTFYLKNGNTWHLFHTFTDAQSQKLAAIEAQAERNVQSDWNITDTNSSAFIKNKPNIAEAITDTTVYKGVWNSSTTYSEGNIVRTGAVRYWILAGGADSTNETPGNEASRWLALNNYYGAWSSSDAPYAVGQMALNDGNVYINTWSNNSDEPGSSSGNGPRWINLSSSGDANVQSDWNEASATSHAYIKNKPDVINANYVEEELRLLNTATLEDGQVVWSGTYKEAGLSRGTQSSPARGMERSEFNGSAAGSTDTDTTALPVSKLTGRQSDSDSYVSAFFWHGDDISLAIGSDGGAGLASHYYSDLRIGLVINGNKVWDAAMSDATASGAGGGDQRLEWTLGTDPFPSTAGREFRLLFYRASTSRGLKNLYDHEDPSPEDIRDELGSLHGDNRMSVNVLKDYIPGDLTANNRETLVDVVVTTGDNPSFTGQATDAYPSTYNFSRALSEDDDNKWLVVGIKAAQTATDRNGPWDWRVFPAGLFRAAANATGTLSGLPTNSFSWPVWSPVAHDNKWVRGQAFKAGDQSIGFSSIQNTNEFYSAGLKVYLQPIVGHGLEGSGGGGLDAQEQADFDALSTGLFKVDTTRRATFNLTAGTSGNKVGWGNATNGNYGSIDQSNIDGEKVSTNNDLANVDIPVLELYSEPDSDPITNEVIIKVSAAHASALQGDWITGLRMFILNATTGAKVLDFSPASFIDLTAANTDKLVANTQANEKFVAGSKYIVGFYKSTTSTDILTAAQILANGNYDIGVRSKGVVSFYKRGSSSSSAPSGKPLLPSIGIPPHVFFGLNGWQIPLIPGVNQSASQIDSASERWYSLAALPVSDGYLWKMTSPYEIDSNTGRVRLTGTKWMRERLTHAAHVDH